MFRKQTVWFKEKALINETYIYKGSKEDFISKLIYLKQPDKAIKFYTSQIKETKFKITDKYSIGTLILNAVRPITGITINGEITNISHDQLLINLKSELRIEIYILLIFVLVSLLILPFTEESIPWFVLFFPIIPIPWFIWIYKLQTVELLSKIIIYFKLEKNNNNSL